MRQQANGLVLCWRIVSLALPGVRRSPDLVHHAPTVRQADHPVGSRCDAVIAHSPVVLHHEPRRTAIALAIDPRVTTKTRAQLGHLEPVLAEDRPRDASAEPRPEGEARPVDQLAGPDARQQPDVRIDLGETVHSGAQGGRGPGKCRRDAKGVGPLGGLPDPSANESRSPRPQGAEGGRRRANLSPRPSRQRPGGSDSFHCGTRRNAARSSTAHNRVAGTPKTDLADPDSLH